MKCFFFLFLFSVNAIAQLPPNPQPVSANESTTSPVLEKVEGVANKIKLEARGTAFNRENSNQTVMVGYEFLSSWLPFKLTAGYTYIFNKEWSLEAEFARGKFGAGFFGVDLASVAEYRYSLIARRYSGNSFNFIFGVYKDDFWAKLGSSYLDDMSDTSIDDFGVKVLGLALGVGNRWQWENGFSLGIDWFRMNAPIFARKAEDAILDNIEDDSDRDMIKSGINKVSKVPTFVLLGLYVGYSF